MSTVHGRFFLKTLLQQMTPLNQLSLRRCWRPLCFILDTWFHLAASLIWHSYVISISYLVPMCSLLSWHFPLLHSDRSWICPYLICTCLPWGQSSGALLTDPTLWDKPDALLLCQTWHALPPFAWHWVFTLVHSPPLGKMFILLPTLATPLY